MLNDNEFSDDFHLLMKSEMPLRVMMQPNENNPIYQKPHKVTYSDGYFYADDTDPAQGPDYYFRDVNIYNKGFVLLPEGQ